MNSESWLSSAEAAARLSKTDRTIRRLCKSGKLVHRKEGKAYLIDPTSLEQFMSESAKKPSSTQAVVSDSPSSGIQAALTAEPAAVTQEPSADTTRTSGMDADRDFDVSDTPPDNSSEEIEIEQDGADIAEKELQQALAEVRKALKERVDTENRCIARFENVLAHLDGKYRAERERNKKVQESLKRLLAELQAPLVDSKSSLWRRLLGRA